MFLSIVYPSVSFFYNWSIIVLPVISSLSLLLYRFYYLFYHAFIISFMILLWFYHVSILLLACFQQFSIIVLSCSHRVYVMFVSLFLSFMVLSFSIIGLSRLHHVPIIFLWFIYNVLYCASLLLFGFRVVIDLFMPFIIFVSYAYHCLWVLHVF